MNKNNELKWFFGGCFHQDWMLESDDWRGQVLTYREGMDFNKRRIVSKAINELVASGLNDVELQRIVCDEYLCHYCGLPGERFSLWLKEVSSLLLMAKASGNQ